VEKRKRMGRQKRKEDGVLETIQERAGQTFRAHSVQLEPKETAAFAIHLPNPHLPPCPTVSSGTEKLRHFHKTGFKRKKREGNGRGKLTTKNIKPREQS
jgi:hypothetical protein